MLPTRGVEQRPEGVLDRSREAGQVKRITFWQGVDMQLVPAKPEAHHLIPVLLVLLGSSAPGVRAEEPLPGKVSRAANGRAAPVEKPATPAATTEKPAAPAEKTYHFEFRNKPWRQVLEWFADQTGLKMISNNCPSDTFTFIPPQGKLYTIPEIVDIVNEALLAHASKEQYVLIRRTQTFTLVPANQKIDPLLLQRVSVADLPRRGQTEIVSVVVPLATLVAADVEPTIKKLLSPFGEAVAIDQANQLVLQDTVASLNQTLKIIRSIEDTEKGAETFVYDCKYIKAQEAERILKRTPGRRPTAVEGAAPPGHSHPWAARHPSSSRGRSDQVRHALHQQ